jgi:hypothetical protein
MRRLLVLLSLVIVLIPSGTSAQQNDFTAGQLVLVAIDGASLVDAPSFIATPVATVAAGEELQVQADEPIETGGTFWWNVRSLERDVIGWIPDHALEPKFLAPTPDPSSRGAGPCDGLDDYAADYLQLFSTTSVAHTDAMEILEAAPGSTEEYLDYIETLSEKDLLALQDFYLALAEEMDRLVPPEFAREWHELQRESLALTGDIYGDAATMGMVAASTFHSQRAVELVEAVDAFFDEPNRCPSFLTWAHAQTLLASL